MGIQSVHLGASIKVSNCSNHCQLYCRIFYYCSVAALCSLPYEFVVDRSAECSVVEFFLLELYLACVGQLVMFLDF